MLDYESAERMKEWEIEKIMQRRQDCYYRRKQKKNEIDNKKTMRTAASYY